MSSLIYATSSTLFCAPPTSQPHEQSLSPFPKSSFKFPSYQSPQLNEQNSRSHFPGRRTLPHPEIINQFLFHFCQSLHQTTNISYNQWHPAGMLPKLVYHNLPIPIILLIKSYLSNRTLKMKIWNRTSSSKNILAGIPQVSSLGSILFNLIICPLNLH